MLPIAGGDDEENLYEVLGVGHIGFNATAEQIKKAYQKMLLVHHPDKKQQNEGAAAAEEGASGAKGAGGAKGGAKDDEGADPAFLAVQNAFDVLSDAEKKRGYDSQFDFDDWIPNGAVDEFGAGKGAGKADFYALYGPVFARNARFSERRPVPALGGDAASDDDVQAFYDFWYAFDSWRDFSKFDEHDPSDAEHRQEKRWMEQQNLTERKRRKKKEMARVLALVERADARDPRLARMRRAEKDAKAAAKRKKAEARAAREAEAEAARAATRAALEAERAAAAAKAKAAADAAKQSKKALKKQLRKRRQKLRACWAAAGKKADAPALEALCSLVEDPAALDALLPSGDGGAFDVERARAAGIAARKAKVERDAAAAAARKEALAREAKAKADKAAAARAGSGAPWDAQDIALLAKAVKRFPAGTRKRWRQVAAFVNANSGKPDVERTREEVIAKATKAKAVAGGDGATVSAGAFASFKSQKKELKDPKAEQRRLANEARARMAAAEANKKGRPQQPARQQQQRPQPAAAAGGGGGGGGGGSAEWTTAQQAALEKGLKTFPSSLKPQERWTKIASLVEGKSMRDCVARFKQLRAMAMARRKAAAAGK